MPQSGAQFDARAHTLRQALGDCQTQPQAFLPVALFIAKLAEFFEDFLAMLWRDAYAGVHHLHDHLHTAPARTDENAARLRVAQGVAHKIAQNKCRHGRVTHGHAIGIARAIHQFAAIGLRAKFIF